MLRHEARSGSQAGFSLAEMVVVTALVVVGTAVAIPISQRMVANARGDTSLVMTATFLDLARSRAVAERRNIELVFVDTTRMQLVRIEVPDGTRTVIADLVLEGEQEFTKDGTLPDTPDAFGAATAVAFTGVPPVMFTSDGSLIDSAGDVTNGTVFVAKPGDLETARAVTITGVTGMVRSWKWRNSQWLR